jgi:hypothetical protein
MTLSQTYRTAVIAIAGFLLTAVFHTGAVAQANSPQGFKPRDCMWSPCRTH